MSVEPEPLPAVGDDLRGVGGGAAVRAADVITAS